MIHFIRKNMSACFTLRQRKSPNTKMLLLPVVGLVLACASCDETECGLPPQSVTDTAPVGDGLKVIGYALLGAAVVVVLGRIIR